uniref:Uncharacterized protein n=1 Tax=Oryza sativa subsp. japonica TaxID=39947 RepID=Q6ERR2_ORYSJ|nr:hypothetical protein [Oryza sativa Japonica Group]BAD33484.1 hypothetical protein [Oryza sativa Japonica Group]
MDELLLLLAATDGLIEHSICPGRPGPAARATGRDRARQSAGRGPGPRTPARRSSHARNGDADVQQPPRTTHQWRRRHAAASGGSEIEPGRRGADASRRALGVVASVGWVERTTGLAS